QVFSQHCPFLMGPIECLADVVTPDTDIQVGTGTRGGTPRACPAAWHRPPVTGLSPGSAEGSSPEEDYKVSCLLLVFVAVSLPLLAADPASFYNPELDG
ncbi:NCKPL protein, partial [Mohoua ochrocephala]|nr:NCKPL protein [Mohoua ochrocephala]